MFSSHLVSLYSLLICNIAYGLPLDPVGQIAKRDESITSQPGSRTSNMPNWLAVIWIVGFLVIYLTVLLTIHFVKEGKCRRRRQPHPPGHVGQTWMEDVVELKKLQHASIKQPPSAHVRLQAQAAQPTGFAFTQASLRLSVFNTTTPAAAGDEHRDRRTQSIA